MTHIGELNFAVQCVKRSDFGSFFAITTNSISKYLEWRCDKRNELHLPSTDPASITESTNSGNHWDASTAEQAASMMCLRIAILRLSAPFIRDICLQDEDCSFNLYTTGLDGIIFADELEEHSIDPDSLIELMDRRCQKILQEQEKFVEKAKKALSRQGILGQQFVETTKQDLLPTKFKTFLSDIIQKMRAGHIAMPKPFGTKALLEAEEKARITAAKNKLEADQKAAQRAKEEAKRSKKAALAKLSRNAGKKAKATAIPQPEEATEIIETFNAMVISSEASIPIAYPEGPSARASTETAVTAETAVTSVAAAVVTYPESSSATSNKFFAPSAAAAAEDDSEIGDTYVSTFFQKADFGKKAAMSSREESADEAPQELRWSKHATEDRYVPSRKITLTSGQHRVLEAIRSGERFSFTMDKFTSFMEGLGITQQSRKGSHAHFSTPGRLPKIFVNPHGWTNTFGPGAMRGMLGLINNLSLGESSEYVD